LYSTTLTPTRAKEIQHIALYNYPVEEQMLVENDDYLEEDTLAWFFSSASHSHSVAMVGVLLLATVFGILHL